LVVVADDADVFRAARETEEDAFLDGVGVLVLVDDDVLEPVHRAVAREEDAVRSALKKREVDAVLAEPIAIELVEAEERGVLDGCLLEDLLRVEVFLREPVEQRLEVHHRLVTTRGRGRVEVRTQRLTERGQLALEAELLDGIRPERALGQREVLVQLVEHGRGRGALAVSDQRAVLKQTVAERVDRADVHAREVVRFPGLLTGEAEQRDEAVLQLLGGLLRERAQEDRFGRHAMEHDQIDDAPEKHARLARAWPGYEKQWAIDVIDGTALILVRREAHSGKEGLDHLPAPRGRWGRCAAFVLAGCSGVVALATCAAIHESRS
jgi:hypothetical protein